MYLCIFYHFLNVTMHYIYLIFIKNFCKENNKEKFNNIYNYSFNLLSTI